MLAIGTTAPVQIKYCTYIKQKVSIQIDYHHITTLAQGVMSLPDVGLYSQRSVIVLHTRLLILCSKVMS